jgi:hypothetical protein
MKAIRKAIRIVTQNIMQGILETLILTLLLALFIGLFWLVWHFGIWQVVEGRKVEICIKELRGQTLRTVSNADLKESCKQLCKHTDFCSHYYIEDVP